MNFSYLLSLQFSEKKLREYVNKRVYFLLYHQNKSNWLKLLTQIIAGDCFELIRITIKNLRNQNSRKCDYSSNLFYFLKLGTKQANCFIIVNHKHVWIILSYWKSSEKHICLVNPIVTNFIELKIFNLKMRS